MAIHTLLVVPGTWEAVAAADGDPGGVTPGAEIGMLRGVTDFLNRTDFDVVYVNYQRVSDRSPVADKTCSTRSATRPTSAPGTWASPKSSGWFALIRAPSACSATARLPMGPRRCITTTRIPPHLPSGQSNCRRRDFRKQHHQHRLHRLVRLLPAGGPLRRRQSARHLPAPRIPTGDRADAVRSVRDDRRNRRKPD